MGVNKNMARIRIGSATVTNGEATTSYTIPSNIATGEHTLYGIFEESDTYETSSGTATFYVRIGTTITVTDVVASIGEQATFTANVKYNTNQNVTEGTVQFMLGNNNIGTPVNVTNGTATLQYEIPSNTSDGTSIKAIYIATNTYASSESNTATLNIRGTTNIVVENISANRGSNANITATITDDDSQPITIGQAQLYIDDTLTGQPVNLSNDGTVTFTYAVANNMVLGSHTIKVEYIQNNSYDTNNGTGTLIIRTPTSLTPIDISANKGGTATVTVIVKDNNNVIVPTGSVNITVGNGSPVTCTVNSSGEATTTVNIPSNASGTIQFTASYIENNNYMASNMATSGVITIRKGVTITVENVNAILGENITLESTLIDENDDEVTSGTVNYEIE